MTKNTSLELPIELKQRIERIAKERNEEPATLLASAIDSLLSAADAQLAEVRRRDLTDTSQSYSNEEAFTRLDSFRPSRRTPSCK
jgi:predicted transcriptional regulator